MDSITLLHTFAHNCYPLRFLKSFFQECFGSPKFQYKQFVCPLRTQTPARQIHSYHYECTDIGFQKMNSLTLCNMKYFEASCTQEHNSLHAFALRLTDCPSRGFVRFVTSSYSRFSSVPVVSRYTCWIVQLAYISFACRTHSHSFILFNK